MIRTSGAVLLGLLGVSTSAGGWGPDGHKITGRVAEWHLDPKAAEAVRKILGPNRSLADISNEADEVRTRRPETAPWHYVNNPIDQKGLNREKFCPAKQCVVGAIERFTEVLKNSGATPQARYEALYFLVHFVGDLHQPLHSGDRRDRGGNDVKVEFLGTTSNLHRVWDSGILLQKKLDPAILAQQLNASISGAQKRAWSAGTPESWSLEAHQLARQVAYRFRYSRTGPVVLAVPYLRRSAPMVERQLSRAGIRLASLLNQLLQ